MTEVRVLANRIVLLVVKVGPRELERVRMIGDGTARAKASRMAAGQWKNMSRTNEEKMNKTATAITIEII